VCSTHYRNVAGVDVVAVRFVYKWNQFDASVINYKQTRSRVYVSRDWSLLWNTRNLSTFEWSADCLTHDGGCASSLPHRHTTTTTSQQQQHAAAAAAAMYTKPRKIILQFKHVIVALMSTFLSACSSVNCRLLRWVNISINTTDNDTGIALIILYH